MNAEDSCLLVIGVRSETAQGSRSGRLVGRGYGVGRGGFSVAARDGAIRIGKVRAEAGKQDAADFAAQMGLKPGESFTAA